MIQGESDGAKTRFALVSLAWRDGSSEASPAASSLRSCDASTTLPSLSKSTCAPPPPLLSTLSSPRESATTTLLPFKALRFLTLSRRRASQSTTRPRLQSDSQATRDQPRRRSARKRSWRSVSRDYRGVVNLRRWRTTLAGAYASRSLSTFAKASSFEASPRLHALREGARLDDD